MSPFGPPWKLALIGAVSVMAGAALLLASWGLAQLAAFVAMLFVARGALHLVTTSFEGATGAISALQGGGEIGVGALLLVWPQPTLLVVAVVAGAWVAVVATVDATLVVTTRAGQLLWPARFAADVIELLLGVALIARPSGTVNAAAVTLGAIAVVAGAIEIAAALTPAPAPREAPSAGTSAAAIPRR
jgi:uncharacterized membrane protein HdeD (DUF308 family)